MKLVQPTAASHVIVQPTAASSAPRRQLDRKPQASNGSILSRIGTPAAAISGTAVNFENLNFDIMKDDIGALRVPRRVVSSGAAHDPV